MRLNVSLFLVSIYALICKGETVINLQWQVIVFTDSYIKSGKDETFIPIFPQNFGEYTLGI